MPENQVLKPYYSMSIFKKILTIITWVVVLNFTGCHNDIFSNDEKIDFMLPSWPEDYPALSRWQIIVCAADFEDAFYLPSKTGNFSLEISPNQALSVTATPIIFLIDGRESSFFKPAGTIYPYSADGDFYSGNLHCQLNWEDGFTAATMQKIIKSRKASGISSQNLKSFLIKFNWKKMSEKIKKNITDSISTFESSGEPEKGKFYNPWQIDSSILLENLTSGAFDSKYLNTTYIFTVSKESAKIPEGREIFASFIPENQILQKYQLLTLKKKTPQSYLLDRTYAVTLNAASAKNVSATFTYMPILIEDYEHPE